MPLFNASTLASYCKQTLRTFATVAKPQPHLPFDQFKILERVTALEKAGKNAVYVTTHQPSGKTFFLKDISDSEQYHGPYRSAMEEGRPTDGIYPSSEEQKFRVEKEVFASRLMNLFVGNNHTPQSIYPVVRNENNRISYLVASESVGEFVSLIENNFYVKDGKTMIKIGDNEYITSGRLGIKIAQDVIRERDGNPQNIGVVLSGASQLYVVTIDHEHAFERDIGTFNAELQRIIEANIFTPFGKKMDLHQEHIHMRDPIRLHTISRITHLLKEDMAIRQIFQNTFSHDHPPIFKKKIQAIVSHLEFMKTIYSEAYDILQRKSFRKSY